MLSVIRLFDFVFSLLGLVVGFPVLLLLTVIGLFDTGSPIFTQERVGRNKRPFTLVKFRTMTKDTASVASHLANVDARLLAETDQKMLENLTMGAYFKYIFMTVAGKGAGDRVPGRD